MKFRILTSALIALTAFCSSSAPSGASSAPLTTTTFRIPGPARVALWYEPLTHVSRAVWATFTCIIQHESRSTWSHPNLSDNNRYGSSGIFQIEQSTWAAHVPVNFPKVWRASPFQQAVGAFAIWRADGFEPWMSDGCVG